ncbi:hypothetical protein L207DRAFT_531723 [Hyaloscypha variabilis F]|uniref:Uncharacterized protein n=1 Tax=Hyaloscypha variabilis (strain UAMH 11265 / GT02V1 / F) TaxID=1149755 RepID=A0A2J6RG00_HYAVF|nr:hypothetical protein L207DRAFT_531723 [Hyaloscypha variabilis F]
MVTAPWNYWQLTSLIRSLEPMGEIGRSLWQPGFRGRREIASYNLWGLWHPGCGLRRSWHTLQEADEKILKLTGNHLKKLMISSWIIKQHFYDSEKCKAYPEKALFVMNRREIPDLEYSPSEIFMGFTQEGDVELASHSHQQESLAAYSGEGSDEPFPVDEIHADLVIDYIQKREAIRRAVQERSDSRNDRNKERHDPRVRFRQDIIHGQMVLYDEKSAENKLRPALRDPFVITGYGADMGKLYTVH